MNSIPITLFIKYPIKVIIKLSSAAVPLSRKRHPDITVSLSLNITYISLGIRRPDLILRITLIMASVPMLFVLKSTIDVIFYFL